MVWSPLPDKHKVEVVLTVGFSHINDLWLSLLSCLHSPSTWSRLRQRSILMLTWCGVRRSIRIRATMIMWSPACAPPLTALSLSGKCPHPEHTLISLPPLHRMRDSFRNTWCLKHFILKQYLNDFFSGKNQSCWIVWINWEFRSPLYCCDIHILCRLFTNIFHL